MVCRSFLERKISTSTGQAETYAMQALAKEVVWTRLLATELRCTLDGPTEVVTDNNGVTKQSTKAVNHSTAKHYRVAQAYIRSLVEDRTLSVGRIDTTNNASDMLTKALYREAFIRHREVIMGPQDDIA